jgi:hypothetical protein
MSGTRRLPAPRRARCRRPSRFPTASTPQLGTRPCGGRRKRLHIEAGAASGR